MSILIFNKFDNLDEIDKFLEQHYLPKLTKKKYKNLNDPIAIKIINF